MRFNRPAAGWAAGLAAGILLSCLWTAGISETARGEEKITYRGGVGIPMTDNHIPVRINPGDCAACRFRIDNEFFSLSVSAPSYSDNDGDLTLSLYRWDESIEQSRRSEPLVKKTFRNFPDNSCLKIDFAPIPAGEYLWTLDDAVGKVGVWGESFTTEDMEFFLNGEPFGGSYEFSLEQELPFPFSGNRRIFQLVSEKSTAPAEIKLTADDPALRRDVMADTWDAIDELGRPLPGYEDAGPVREDRQTGIFYWTWHDSLDYPGPFDNTKILADHPEAALDLHFPGWGPVGARHHWGEPLFGYYTTLDKWIHRKHAEMLADAGVDAVIFDATNGTLTWMDSVTALAETYEQALRDGVRTPKFAFMLPFGNLEWTAVDLVQLWRDIYRDGKYQNLWFYWDGKPLIYGLPDALDALIEGKAENPDIDAEKDELIAIRQFFSFRPGQPAYTGGPRRGDNWSWLEVYPQHGYGERSDGTFDMISVGVAQNHSQQKRNGTSGLAAMNDQHVFGRAYVVGEPEDTRPDADLYGGNFQQQWSRAFELDPRFVFITGWNEWIAGRAPEWSGTVNAFPDEFNEPYSRDIEPERGRLMDNYYLQMTANIRRYKGVRPQPAAGGASAISFNEDSVSQWDSVTPEYRDYRGDTLHRNAGGYGGISYVNETGRNDIISAKVSRDEENLYFLVETADQLTAPDKGNWMRLFISTQWSADGDRPNWEHFQYFVEESADGAVLKRSAGGWNWEDITAVTRRIEGNRLELAVPLSALGGLEGKIDIRFKWSDNMQNDGDVLDFYVSGDTAPDGRFVYRYYEK